VSRRETLRVFRWSPLAGALGVAVALAACDSPFPGPSRVESVRVLGAVMDNPIAHPGEEVHVALIVHDGGAPLDAPRPLEIAWFFGCHNPADDAPGNCYQPLGFLRDISAEAFAEHQTNPPAVPDGATLAYGAQTTVKLPDDIVATHRPIDEETVPRGLSYLFFAVCQGNLAPYAGTYSPAGIPITCRDATTGQEVGASRFVSGYVTLRVSETVRNDNPVLVSLQVGATAPSAVACTGDEGCPAGEGCGAAGRCLPVVARCTDKSVDDCPAVTLRPQLAESSFEADSSAPPDLVPTPPETLWISYFATAGELDGDSRMIVDPSEGRRPDGAFSGEWKLDPGFVGEARVFAVVHDNRGGGAVSSQDVLVR
jgi:hypothetical protein